MSMKRRATTRQRMAAYRKPSTPSAEYTMKSRTCFSQTAINAFGGGLSYRYGVTVKFGKVGAASTNGNEVLMPACNGYLSQLQFESFCGIAVHEISHCLFRSPERMKAFITSTTSADPDVSKELAQNCYNAAIDISDESRLELYDQLIGYPRSTRSQHLLAVKSAHTMDKNVAKGVFDEVKEDSIVWQALVIGMLYARPPKYPWRTSLKPKVAKARNTMKQLLTDAGIDMDEIIRVLKQCVTQTRDMSNTNGSNSVHRDHHQWEDVARRARELVDLLKSKSGQGGGGGGEGEAPDGAIVNVVIIGQGETDDDGNCKGDEMQKIPKGWTYSNGNDQTDISGGKKHEFLAPFAGGKANYRETVKPDEEVQRTLGSYVSQLIAQAAEDDVNADVSGYASGNRIGQVHRACTDGRIMQRVLEDGDEYDDMACAIALDTSGSMDRCVKQCCAIAEAFRLAVNGIGADVKCWKFSGEAQEIRGFDEVLFNGGGTATDAAMWPMYQWLMSTYHNRRYLVLATDGMPNSTSSESVKHICNECKAVGIKVIVVYLSFCDSSKIWGMEDSSMQALAEKQEQFPGAVIAQANDTMELSQVLTTVGRELATI